MGRVVEVRHAAAIGLGHPREVAHPVVVAA
jgi:hypothetical protein